MEVGETKTVATLAEINALEAGRDEYVGRDREADNFRIAETEVVDEHVAVIIEADVTKVDPDTKPVFQTEHHFENGYNHSRRPWYQPYANGAVATLIAGIVTLGVATDVLQEMAPEMDIHPLLLAAGDLAPVAMVVAIVAAVVGLLSIGPGGSWQ